ncbi:hypothetical protein [Paenibacillus radicibacter]|uniref:hypothetical protein n=1 Tax=Paenibacillus radicibacter TaxID=2972488 RepID=UPI002158C967|nr:hypothetical protein [Paenibacillus radicibacter]
MELLKKTFNFYFSNFKNIVLIMLATYIPIQILSYKLIRPEFFEYLFMHSLIVILVSIPFSIWGSAALIQYTYIRLSEGRSLTFKEAYLDCLKSLPRLIGYGLVTGLITMIGIILLIIPGIFFALRLGLYSIIIIADGENRSNPFKKSYELMKGRTLEFFWLSLLLIIMNVILEFVVEFITGLFLSEALSTIVSGLTSDLFMVTYALIFIIAYVPDSADKNE